MKAISQAAVTIAAIGLLASSALAGNHANKHSSAKAAEKNIVETAVAAGSFQTLATALTEAGLADVLANGGPFTVFAPTDEAFAKLPKGTVESLLMPQNRERLIAILKYHVVSGEVLAKDVVKLDAAVTLNEQRVDVLASGRGVKIDDASVITTDVLASNGVIHVIDRVLIPTDKTVVGVANEAGSFGTLLAAVQAAGLADALMGQGPFTLFAPTDAAFDALPDGTVASLLEERNRGKLQQILKFHVVPGRIFSGDVLEQGKLDTLSEFELHATVKNGKARIQEAGLVKTDIDASNGVIHVIDRVLMPPTEHSSSSPSGCSASCSGKIAVAMEPSVEI